MGSFRIFLLVCLITGTLAFHTWQRQPASSGGIDWDSLRHLTDAQKKEELCRHDDPYCFMTYSGGMFTTHIWPCGRKCP